ncbi:MAG: BMP family ABC transporter substrate-binding protein [Actinomycetaceae bacterium]|nr:BMP family ABC transporter substrate-binding protein [Actinomycetaceae bacterium]
MKKSLPAALLALMVTASLAACGAAPEKEATPEATDTTDASAPAADFKACMVSDQGGFDDKSFNQSGKEGLDKAKAELGIAVSFAESKDPGDFVPNINNLIAEKCGLIIGVGFMLNDAIRDAAQANPDVHFALVDSRITDKEFNVLDLPNAKPLIFNTAEAAYLAGYAAAAMSESSKVGTFGGMQIPSVSIFMDGFADGVARFNEDAGAAVQLLGWDKAAQNGSFVGSFEDQNKAKQLSEGLLSQGADVIMPVAGPLGAATATAVKESEANDMVIWVDSDGFESTSDGAVILTSVVKEIGQSVFDSVKASKEGNFSSAPYVGTLENKGVSLAPFHDFDSKVPAPIKETLKKLQDEIVAGTLKVETTNQP